MIRDNVNLDCRLDLAINDADRPGYLAAARYHWPLDLLELRDAKVEVERLNGDMLRQHKVILTADDLAHRVHDYIMQYVKEGPHRCDDQAGALIKAVELYREQRGIQP